MTPYFSRDGIVIYHGDCRDVLPGLAAVDLVLTDPPYGHGDLWAGGTWAAKPMYQVDARRWDAAPVDGELLRLAVGKATNAIVWGGNYFELPPSRCWLAWMKSSPMPTLADFELAWTNLDRPAKAFRANRNDGARSHPTQKPITLFRWCIQQAPIGTTVLDPFMGSGTTLRAALDLGRKAIGIEIEERYCEIAARRLDQMAMRLEVSA